MTYSVQGTADQLIEQLMALHPKGYDLSLERITNLLEKLGNPQDKLPPVIHVAGTNGKGSLTAFTRSLLEAEGYRVHVHTSPHLVCWHERFRIGQDGGGKFVEDHLLAEVIQRAAAANNNAFITVFEILTAAMFLLFSEHPADIAIIEVGLGGRFDATNVIKAPHASVIMPISLDHQNLLGDSVKKIAFEKAGIIKHKHPVIIGHQLYDDALNVIIRQAQDKQCTIAVFGQDFIGFEACGRFIYQDENSLMDLPLPKLIGNHQCENAATAIKAVKNAGFSIGQSSCENAMKNVVWPGRMQKLSGGALVQKMSDLEPEIYVDGGHNADAARAIMKIVRQLNDRDKRPLYIISAMLDTKEPKGFFSPFQGWCEKIITIPITTSEAGIDAIKLARLVKTLGIPSETDHDIWGALQNIRAHYLSSSHQKSLRILFCGSLYLVGDVLVQNGTPPR